MYKLLTVVVGVILSYQGKNTDGYFVKQIKELCNKCGNTTEVVQPKSAKLKHYTLESIAMTTQMGTLCKHIHRAQVWLKPWEPEYQ